VKVYRHCTLRFHDVLLNHVQENIIRALLHYTNNSYYLVCYLNQISLL